MIKNLSGAAEMMGIYKTVIKDVALKANFDPYTIDNDGFHILPDDPNILIKKCIALRVLKPSVIALQTAFKTFEDIICMSSPYIGDKNYQNNIICKFNYLGKNVFDSYESISQSQLTKIITTRTLANAVVNNAFPIGLLTEQNIYDTTDGFTVNVMILNYYSSFFKELNFIKLYRESFIGSSLQDALDALKRLMLVYTHLSNIILVVNQAKGGIR